MSLTAELLPVIILIPLAGFLTTLFLSNNREKAVFWTAIITLMAQSAVFLFALTGWIMDGTPSVHGSWLPLYHAKDGHFSIDFYMDATSAVYFSVMVLISFAILWFSRTYLHRERGFKRFFANILFFYLGLTVIAFAGNFETLLIGWEFIGITSFFLIAFYRHRYLPVKNALKVVSLYRVADVFLLFAIWLCHHYFGTSMTFSALHQQPGPDISDPFFQIAIPATFILVALVKSAQFPFTSWLPRAMEGPTSSSAIFYGSLSVHIGLFLLMRTFPLWDDQTVFRWLVGGIGALTAVMATLTARVQPSVKSQIAYSSAAQIGIMVIEVAAGWHTLALVHFAGHAFLRTYQLLVSPSILSYLIHDQFFHFIPPARQEANSLWDRIRLTVYVLSLKEWNLDRNMHRWLWHPLKSAGNHIRFLTAKGAVWVFVPLYAIGVWGAFNRNDIPYALLASMPVLLAAVSLLLVLKAFVKRNRARNAWMLTIVSQLFVGLAIAYNEQFDPFQVLLFYSGISLSAIIGFWTFRRLEKGGASTVIDRFRGYSLEHPRLAALFLVACLGMVGFPITPTFIGEDLILGHVRENQYVLTFLIGLTLILDGLAVFRIYARLFLGPHEKGWHEVPYRSA